MRSATMRATGSTAPPGGNGTIIVIGRDGKSWAIALPTITRAAKATARSSFPMPSILDGRIIGALRAAAYRNLGDAVFQTAFRAGPVMRPARNVKDWP